MTTIPASDRTVTAGDNAPPDPLAATRKRVDDLLAATNKWLKATEKPRDPAKPDVIQREITDLEMAKACEDFFNQLRKMFGDTGTLEKDRKAMNEPLRKQVEANNALFEPLKRAGQAMLTLVSGLRTGWLKKEQDRIDRERIESARAAAEAQRLADEARRAAAAATTVEEIIIVEEAIAVAEQAAATAEAKQAEKPQVKGEFSSRAGSLRTFYSAEVKDHAAALAHYAGHSKIREAVELLASTEARTMKEEFNVPGCALKKRQEGV